jgi:hypothetical protein
MENNAKNHNQNRFNVVIRIKPQMKDDYNELSTEEEMSICTTKYVKINFKNRVNERLN